VLQAASNPTYFAETVDSEILEAAARRSGIPTTNLRVGQLSGGYNGAWSTTDWVPIIAASSVHLGCLPDAIGVSVSHHPST